MAARTTTTVRNLSFGDFSDAQKLKKTNGFITSRAGVDRFSKPHTITKGTFDDLSREIRVYTEENRMLRCKIDRMPTVTAARKLWKDLVKAHNEGTTVRFVAAGGFDPEQWFYALTAE